MACKNCEERRQKMKQAMQATFAAAARLAGLRRGEPAPDTASPSGEGTAKGRHTAIGGTADKAKPAHRKRRVAKAPRGGAGA